MGTCSEMDEHVADVHIPIVFPPAWFLTSICGFIRREGFRFSTGNCVTSQPRHFACNRRNPYLRFPQTVRRTINTEN